MAYVEKCTYVIMDGGLYKKDVIFEINGKPVEGEEVIYTFITNEPRKPNTGTIVDYTRREYKPDNEENFRKVMMGKPKKRDDFGWESSGSKPEQVDAKKLEEEMRLPEGTGRHVQSLNVQWDGNISFHLYTTDEDIVKKIAKYVDDFMEAS